MNNAKAMLERFMLVDEVTGLASIRIEAVSLEGEVFLETFLIDRDKVTDKQAQIVTLAILRLAKDSVNYVLNSALKGYTPQQLVQNIKNNIGVEIDEDKAEQLLANYRSTGNES